jgi:hypothetical protein
MGMDLENSKGYFRWNIWYWRDVLDLGLMYGWQPMGTELESEEDWCGTYYTNDGQLVNSDDALALADTLELAVNDIPDATALGNPNSSEQIGTNEDEFDPEADLLSKFSGEEKPYLKEFITFCREGGFNIY